jgi:TM2 domain
MPFCYSCGAEANERAVVCVKCGVALTPSAGAAGPGQNPANVSDKEWLPAVLLCFFLGVFGVHRFYTGHTVIGVAQLLTLGGCGIWALIDFILILVGSYKDAQGRPLRK